MRYVWICAIIYGTDRRSLRWAYIYTKYTELKCVCTHDEYSASRRRRVICSCGIQRAKVNCCACRAVLKRKPQNKHKFAAPWATQVAWIKQLSAHALWNRVSPVKWLGKGYTFDFCRLCVSAERSVSFKWYADWWFNQIKNRCRAVRRKLKQLDVTDLLLVQTAKLDSYWERSKTRTARARGTSQTKNLFSIFCDRRSLSPAWETICA